MASDRESIDEIFVEIKLKLYELRSQAPGTVEELKTLVAQLEDFVEKLVIDSTKLERIKEKLSALTKWKDWDKV